jgi:large subunit ribosomal protein L25
MTKDKITLNVAPREISGKKVKKLRAQGIVPGMVYGRDIESYKIQIELLSLIKVIKQAGTHTPVELDMDGNKQLAIIKAVTRAVAKTTPIHIEFQAVSADQAVRTEVPIRIIDEEESQAKKLGFLFMQNLEEIEVKAKPADLPEFLAVSAKNLEKHDDKLLISDIIIPDGVELWVDDMDVVILTVADPSILAAKNEAEEQAEESSEKPDEATSEASAETPTNETEKAE